MDTPLARVGLWPRISQDTPVVGFGNSYSELPHVSRLLRSRETLLVLAISSAWYLVGVWYLLVYLEWFDPDTLSRMANAFYVLYSREPHLAAIGFVWPPALGAAMMPLLLLYPLWPLVASHGLAAGVVSAVAGAMFAAVTFAIMRAAGLPRWGCWGFVGALWVNPMWWYSSTNGLSEMPFLLLLLLSIWLLWRWLNATERSYLPILANGAICAVALMIRYEMLAWGIAVAAVTLLAGLLRRSSAKQLDQWARVHRAQALTLAFVLPWGFIFLLWIFFNWQIVGNPLYFLSSAYACRTGVTCTPGGEPQALADAAGSGSRTAIAGLAGAVGFVVGRVAYVNPALFICLPLACLAALRRGRWHGLALASPALAVMAMHAGMLYRGNLNTLLRYHLLGIPATIVVMMWLYGGIAQRGGSLRQQTALSAAVVAAGWVMAATTTYAMADPNLGIGTWEAFWHFALGVPTHAFNADRQLAAYLDSFHLPDGSVLIDSATGYGVIVSSLRPKQFVIDSDSDFAQVLGHPEGRVRYAVVGMGDNFDILLATYPGLVNSGVSFARLEREFHGVPRMGDVTETGWRLFRVNGDEAGGVPEEAETQAEGTPGTAEMGPATAAVTTAVAEATRAATSVTARVAEPTRATATPGSLPRLVLDDRFTDRGASTPWVDMPGVAWLDANGYRLAAGNPNQFVALDAPLAQPYQNVLVTGRFHKVGGPSGGGYGLIVGDQEPSLHQGLKQRGDFYVLEASDVGEIGVWRRVQDHWLELMPWARSAAVKPGQATNELQVNARANELTFEINGAVVADLTGVAVPSGEVGVFLGGDLNQGVLERFTVETGD